MYSYSHGGNAVFEPDSKDLVDLSANINPLGFPKGVYDAICNDIPFVARYPDSASFELRKQIALWENTDPEWIFCGNGASDIIFRIPLCVKPTTALLPAPSFSDYERSLKSYGANVLYLYLSEHNGFAIDSGMTDTISKSGASIVFICNPNNPTGVITKRDEIEEIVSFCKKRDIFLVIDECFLDFVENSHMYTVKPLMCKYDNLIILKAFTKIFALPGIRLGYALCKNEHIINELYNNGADWPVSNLAQAAGIAALKNAASSSYLNDTVAFVSEQRALLCDALKSLGYITFDSRANYIFFKNPYNFNIHKELNELNIRIRNCGNYVGLTDKFCRIAVSIKDNNCKLIESINKITDKRNGFI